LDNEPPIAEVAALPDSSIPWGALGDLSPWAILALTVLLLLFGRIIPGRTHDREIAAKDATIKDLQATVRIERETNDVLAETNRTLAHDLAAPIAKIMNALREQAEGAGERH
jgi:uncharacterized protein YoxC